MKSFTIAEDVELDTVATSTAVQPNDTTPFMVGREAVLVVNTSAMTGGTSPSFKVEGSDDGTTYTALKTVTAEGPVTLTNIVIPAYLRVNVTVVSTGGTASAYLLAGV